MFNTLLGWYALNVYLPLSGASRRFRRLSRRLRGKEEQGLQQVCIPPIGWKDITKKKLVPLLEHEKANGNVRISELAIIAVLASEVENGADIFEIGTFDGRTTLNMAVSCPTRSKVYTLDLPPDLEPAMSLEEGERHMVEKQTSGARIKRHRENRQEVQKIHQLYGDSARFDFANFYDTCGLVFVDGSHAFDYVVSDIRASIEMLRDGGVLLCHDYGIWSGVTAALEELSRRELEGVRNIYGTSLAYWKKPKCAQREVKGTGVHAQ